MATLFDISILESGSTFFAFLMVLVTTYAILTKVDFLKLSKFNATVLAICFSMLTLFTPALLNSIKVMVPWFGVVVAFILFIMMALFTMGYTQSDMNSALASKEYGIQIKIWVIVIGAIIFISAVSSQFSVFSGDDAPVEQQVTNNNQGQATVSGNSQTRDFDGSAIDEKGEDALIATLFHPKMLGMMALMLIAVFAAIFLSTSNKV